MSAPRLQLAKTRNKMGYLDTSIIMSAFRKLFPVLGTTCLAQVVEFFHMGWWNHFIFQTRKKQDGRLPYSLDFSIRWPNLMTEENKVF
jgi:hypothetical protein